MGAVASFVKDVGTTVLKAAAKAGTSALGAMVPYVGTALADKVNSMYAKGGAVLKCDMGGSIPDGVKKVAINTPAQLISLIKANPALAEKHDLSVEKVKEAVAEHAQMKRGGRASKFMDAHYDGAYAHGGRVAALPQSNLNRLVPLQARGGSVGLSHGEGEHFFAVLHHGHSRGMRKKHLA